MSIPKAKCPKCGAEYTGWALSNPRHRKCRKCGADLVITDEQTAKKIVDDYPLRKNAWILI